MDTEKVRKDKNIKKLAKSVAEKVVDQLEGEGEIENLEYGTVEESIESSDLDIFEDVAAKASRAGDRISFTIYKNSELLTTKHWPYSWAKIQEDFGAGHYQIICRSRNLNKIIKKQTMDVAAPEIADAETNGNGHGFTFGQQSVGSAGAQPPSDLMGMLTFLKTFNSDSESKARDAAERERRNSQDSNNVTVKMMETIMTMSQHTSSETQKMILEMTKNNMQMFEKISQSTQTMIQNMNDRFEKMLGSKKDDGLTPLQFQKDMREAEERGYAKAEKIFELIEKKSDEKAEVKAELLAGDKEEPSLISSLSKNFLPVIAAQLQAHTKNQAAQAQATQAQADAQTKAIQAQQLQQRVVRPVGQERPAFVPGQNVEPTQANKEIAQRREQFRQHVLSQVLPVIADGLVNAGKPGEYAKKALEILWSGKNVETGQPAPQISAKDVVDNFTLQDIINIAKEGGLPPEANPWLSQFFKAVQLAARPPQKPVARPVAPIKSDVTANVSGNEKAGISDANIQNAPGANAGQPAQDHVGATA